MSHLKISFSPKFFSTETKRTKEQLISNNDLVCQHLSDVYTQATEVLKSPIQFTELDETEIARADTYAYLGSNTIYNARNSLRKKGMAIVYDTDPVLALLLQTKIGLPVAIGKQMELAVLEMSNGEAHCTTTNFKKDQKDNANKISFSFNKRRHQATIIYKTDILNTKEVKIGSCEFTVSYNLNTKVLKLNNFDITIDAHAPEKEIFKAQAKCFNADRKSQACLDANDLSISEKDKLKPIRQGFFDRIFGAIKSLLTRTETIVIKPSQINHEAIKQRQIEVQKKFKPENDTPFRVYAQILTADELDKLKQAKQQKPAQQVIESEVKPVVTRPATPVQSDNVIEKSSIMQLVAEQEERFRVAMTAHREIMQRNAEQIARTEKCIVEATRLLNELEKRFPTPPIVCC